MSAPYSVHAGPHFVAACMTFEEALKIYRMVKLGRIYGAGAEGGYGDDGQQFHDGLTEEERDEL